MTKKIKLLITQKNCPCVNKNTVHLILFPHLKYLYLHITPFPIICAVPSMAAVISSMSCFRAMLLRYFLKILQMVPVNPTINIFKFHISYISILNSSYFNTFQLLSLTYICWNFLVYEQTSYFLITPIEICGLMLRIVLWAFTCLFHNVVTLASWLVPSTNLDIC